MAKQQTFEVRFEPTVAGSYSGNVVITSDAISSPDTIALSGLGVGTYDPNDLTILYVPFKYASKNIYRAGAVALGPSVTDVITESLIRILNVPEFAGLTFDPTKRIPAPPKSLSLIFREVDSSGEDGTEYTMNMPDVEPLYIRESTTNVYYTDTSDNDTAFFFPNSKDIESYVSNTGNLIYALNSLVHTEFTYANTGDTWKYGYITMINYLLNNIEKFKKICIMNNVDYSDLEYYETHTPYQCWREKSLTELGGMMTDATIHTLVTKYSINYEYTDLEIVLYYFLDIYDRLFNG